MDNKAQAFLQEYRDVISLQVFEHGSSQYRSYLEKLIKKRNKLLENDFIENERAFRQHKAIEETISIMMGFLSITETTFQVLSEKVYDHLNFDVEAWERYRAIEKEADLWLQLYKQKLKEGKHELK